MVTLRRKLNMTFLRDLFLPFSYFLFPSDGKKVASNNARCYRISSSLIVARRRLILFFRLYIEIEDFPLIRNRNKL